MDDEIRITSRIKPTWTTIDNPTLDLPSEHYAGTIRDKNRVVNVSGTFVKFTWLIMCRLAFSGSATTTYTHLTHLTGISASQLRRVFKVMVNKGWLGIRRRRAATNPKHNLPNLYTLLQLPGTITMERGTTTMEVGTTTVVGKSSHRGTHITTTNTPLITHSTTVMVELERLGVTKAGQNTIISKLDADTILGLICYARKHSLKPGFLVDVARHPDKLPVPEVLERYRRTEPPAYEPELLEPEQTPLSPEFVEAVRRAGLSMTLVTAEALAAAKSKPE